MEKECGYKEEEEEEDGWEEYEACVTVTEERAV